MNIFDLISTLTQFVKDNPKLTSKKLTYNDRDEGILEATITKISYDSHTDSVFVDVGGQYLTEDVTSTFN